MLYNNKNFINEFSNKLRLNLSVYFCSETFYFRQGLTNVWFSAGIQALFSSYFSHNVRSSVITSTIKYVNDKLPQAFVTVSFQTITNLHFSGFYFFHILKAYVRIYQLAILILINLWIIADSNSVRTVLSPLEKHRSVLNHAPRACAQGVSASCSHKRNTLNAYRTVTNQSRSSICGGFTLRALGNHASYRHKGIRIRVLNILVH